MRYPRYIRTTTYGLQAAYEIKQFTASIRLPRLRMPSEFPRLFPRCHGWQRLGIPLINGPLNFHPEREFHAGIHGQFVHSHRESGVSASVAEQFDQEL